MTAQGDNGLVFGRQEVAKNHPDYPNGGYTREELTMLGRAAWKALSGQSAPLQPMSALDRIPNPLTYALRIQGGPAAGRAKSLAGALGVQPRTVRAWMRGGKASARNQQHLRDYARGQHVMRTERHRASLLKVQPAASKAARWRRGEGALKGRVRKSADDGHRNLYVPRWGRSGNRRCAGLWDELAEQFTAGASLLELGDLIATAMDDELNEEHSFEIVGPEMTLDI